MGGLTGGRLDEARVLGKEGGWVMEEGRALVLRSEL